MAFDLRTVAQLVAERPVLTERGLRMLVFRAKQNGLAPAIVRRGRRVYIDLQAFDRWLRTGKAEPGDGPPAEVGSRGKR